MTRSDYRDDYTEYSAQYPNWLANPRIKELDEIIEQIKEGKSISIPSYWPSLGEEINGHEIDEDDFLELEEELAAIKEGKLISVTKSGKATVTITIGKKPSGGWTEPEYIRMRIRDATEHRDLSNINDRDEVRKEIGISRILSDNLSVEEDLIEAVIDTDSEYFKYFAPELSDSKIHILSKAYYKSDKYFIITIRTVEQKWEDFKNMAKHITGSVYIKIL